MFYACFSFVFVILIKLTIPFCTNYDTGILFGNLGGFFNPVVHSLVVNLLMQLAALVTVVGNGKVWKQQWMGGCGFLGQKFRW